MLQYFVITPPTGCIESVQKDFVVVLTVVEILDLKENGRLFFFQSNFTQKSVENKNYRFKLNDRDQSTMKTDENDHKQLLTFIFINSIENPPLILGFYV